MKYKIKVRQHDLKLENAEEKQVEYDKNSTLLQQLLLTVCMMLAQQKQW